MVNRSGNPTWQDSPSTATKITAARLNAIEGRFNTDGASLDALWAQFTTLQAQLAGVVPQTGGGGGGGGTESASGTLITATPGSPSAGSITTVTGLVASISSGGQILLNGTADTTSNNVVSLYYASHVLYQQNTFGEWYTEPETGGPGTFQTTDPTGGTGGGGGGGTGAGDSTDFTTTQPVGPTGTTWILDPAHADDFTYSSISDSTFLSKWIPNRLGPFGNTSPTGWYVDGGFNPGSEQACFAASQVKFGIVPSCVTFNVAANSTGFQGSYAYMSGTISSQNHYNQWKDHTYVEARMRLHSGSYLWPAFWGVVNSGTYEEMDIFEFFGNNQGEVNWHPPGGGQTGPTAFGPTTLLDSFHTWGFERDAAGASTKMFIDGINVATGPTITTTNPYFIIFNLAVQTGGTPATGNLMDIDWFRPWHT